MKETCFFFKSNYYTSVINGRGGSRGETRGGPPLVLDQIEARLFFETAPPPFSKGLDDAPPPPRPLYLKVWIRL